MESFACINALLCKQNAGIRWKWEYTWQPLRPRSVPRCVHTHTHTHTYTRVHPSLPLLSAFHYQFRCSHGWTVSSGGEGVDARTLCGLVHAYSNRCRSQCRIDESTRFPAATLILYCNRQSWVCKVSSLFFFFFLFLTLTLELLNDVTWIIKLYLLYICVFSQVLHTVKTVN